MSASAATARLGRRGDTGERKWLTDNQMLTLIRAIRAELKGAYVSLRIVKVNRPGN